MEVLKARKADYASLRKQLTESDDSQIRLTDPDARSLIKHDRESLVGYNVQSAVDDANKLIGHSEITNQNDLKPGAEILADKGYYNATEMQKVRIFRLSGVVVIGHSDVFCERPRRMVWAGLN